MRLADTFTQRRPRIGRLEPSIDWRQGPTQPKTTDDTPRRDPMKRTRVIVAGITAVFLMGLFVRADAQAPTFKRTVLQQGDLSTPGREAVMALAEIQPNGASGRHTHPGEEVAYVLAGPMILEIDGKPAKTLQTGE